MLDALRLAEAMTYKAAVAGLPLGGGKAVLFADGREQDPAVREARLLAYGRVIEQLGGMYITAEDANTTMADMAVIRRATRHVAGLAPADGGGGDPSPVTAVGVLAGMQALAADVLGVSSLSGVRVAIQGLGKVGLALAELLVAEGAAVTACDVRPEVARAAAEALGIAVVAPEAIFDVPCAIFAPCAYGGVLNDETIPRLTCQIVAGSANNQLREPRHAEALRARGIAYAVDYVINAGGLIKRGAGAGAGWLRRGGGARADAGHRRDGPAHPGPRRGRRHLHRARGARPGAGCHPAGGEVGGAEACQRGSVVPRDIQSGGERSLPG